MIRFTIEGRAQAAGSKKAFPIRRANGRIGVAVADDNPKAKLWQTQVREAATAACAGYELPVFLGPVRLCVEFHLERPKAHYGAKGLKDSAPARPTTRPDATKLLRGVEDALTGVLWRDDAQVVDQTAIKYYAAGYSFCMVTVEAQP